VKLYPFQKALVDRFEIVPAVLIGDDMGTGKTFEALALDLRRRTTQLTGYKQTDCKTLIVAPLSVLGSWEKHIGAIWNGARVAVLNPKNRDDLIRKLRQPYHYYVIHWEALRLMPELQDVHWWHVIADEVHRGKNRKAQQTLNLKKLKTSYKTGLSGTPADNAPQDLWSILHWLYPKIWSSYHRFTNYFVKIQKHTMGTCTAAGCTDYHKSGFQKIVGVANVGELHQAMAPYYLRRTKEEVIKDLPDKYYTTIEVDLAPRQRKIYDQMKESMLAWVGQHEHEPVAAPVVIAQLTRLKQFALAYAEVEPVRKMVDGEWRTFDKIKLMDPSSKLDVVMEKVLDNPEQQFVVFSESKQIINLLNLRLTAAKVSHVLLTGDTPQSEREANIDKFQAGKARVFAGTIHAGGEGITLTAASTVIFLDRTWNPSRNKQAEDRCHRIGQKSAVHVIDIVARDTVDGGRLQQLDLKWGWLKELLGDKKKEEVNA
jgi:SNF2 family DNA or RNA helicase